MIRAIRTVRPHRDGHRHRLPSFFLLRSVGTSTLRVSSEPMHTASDFKTSGTGRALAVLTSSRKNWDSGSVREVSGDLCFKLDPMSPQLGSSDVGVRLRHLVAG
jgi:hypothetical protein